MDSSSRKRQGDRLTIVPEARSACSGVPTCPRGANLPAMGRGSVAHRELVELSEVNDAMTVGDLHRMGQVLVDARPGDEDLRVGLGRFQGEILGERLLTHLACIVTPDTILRRHRRLIAAK